MKIVRLKTKKRKNPKKGRPKMAKKRKSSRKKKAVKITVNPKRRRKHRKNPVKFSSRRKYRRNPGFSPKGILEQIKPIALGAVGALVISKIISMVPISPEKENLKPWIKLGAGVGIAYFGRKYSIAKLGGLFIATLAVRDMIAEKFPALVAGTDDYFVEGYDDYEDQLLGNQVAFMGNQVSFAGNEYPDTTFSLNGDYMTDNAFSMSGI